MAQYPIKMLKDENGTPFVPLVAPEAVKDNQGTDWQTLIDRKLEKTNIIAGNNITLSVSGNDITINSQAGGATTNVIDNLNQSTGGVGVLDAHQGYVLKGMIPGVQNNLTSTSTTDALSAYQGYLLSNRVVPAGGTANQVLAKNSATDNDLKWLTLPSVVDNLTSTSTTDVLSAKQGKVLKDLVDTKVNTFDIVNNLTSTVTNKPLSAAQGKALNDKVTNLKRVELFSGSWARGETKTIDTSSYVKLEILMSLNPSGSAYNTIYTISYDNAGNRTGLISGVTKCMNGYFYQVEIQKQASNKIFFDYGAYAHQESMNSWTQDSTSKGIITKVYGYKEI